MHKELGPCTGVEFGAEVNGGFCRQWKLPGMFKVAKFEITDHFSIVCWSIYVQMTFLWVHSKYKGCRMEAVDREKLYNVHTEFKSL